MQKYYVLTLSMLLSQHGIQAARYVNYDTVLKVTAKLKTLERNVEKIEACEKEFTQQYSRLLLPRDHNKLYVLILELLDTAETKSTKQQDNVLQVLDMIDEELRGLINRYGYRKELVALSHRTSVLRADISQNSIMNSIYAPALKRYAQDLFAEALLTDTLSEAIQKRVAKHMRTIQSKTQKKENKESQVQSTEPSQGTDTQHE